MTWLRGPACIKCRKQHTETIVRGREDVQSVSVDCEGFREWGFIKDLALLCDSWLSKDLWEVDLSTCGQYWKLFTDLKMKNKQLFFVESLELNLLSKGKCAKSLFRISYGRLQVAAIFLNLFVDLKSKKCSPKRSIQDRKSDPEPASKLQTSTCILPMLLLLFFFFKKFRYFGLL